MTTHAIVSSFFFFQIFLGCDIVHAQTHTHTHGYGHTAHEEHALATVRSNRHGDTHISEETGGHLRVG